MNSPRRASQTPTVFPSQARFGNAAHQAREKADSPAHVFDEIARAPPGIAAVVVTHGGKERGFRFQV